MKEKNEEMMLVAVELLAPIGVLAAIRIVTSQRYADWYDQHFVDNKPDSRLRDLLKTPEGREQALAEGLVREHNKPDEGTDGTK